MVRLVLLLLAAILYLILTLPVLFILWLIGKKNPDLRERAASAMIRWIFRVLLAGAGVKVTVIGQDRIPSDTAVLYVGNHRSIFDIIHLCAEPPRHGLCSEERAGQDSPFLSVGQIHRLSFL